MLDILVNLTFTADCVEHRWLLLRIYNKLVRRTVCLLDRWDKMLNAATFMHA